MLDEIFKRVDELKEATTALDKELQDLRTYIDEYLTVTQNVFGKLKQEEKVVKAPVKPRVKSKRSPRTKYMTKQEKLEMLAAIEQESLTPKDAADMYGVTRAYIYNLLSAYRRGLLDDKTTEVVSASSEEKGSDEGALF